MRRPAQIARGQTTAANRVRYPSGRAHGLPIITVGQPIAIGFAGPIAAPGFSTMISATRHDIWLLIRTVALPFSTEPTPSAPLMLTAGQACWSMSVRHAGCPPIRTLALPGPGAVGAPCVVGSPTLA